MMPAAFQGRWVVDEANSDSIEPMLKGMGVDAKIRRVVTKLKVEQTIQVGGDKLIVSNISKQGQDSATHIINGGQCIIKTNRGDEVLDTCTFDRTRAFPLEINAVLPRNKGSTVDRRKLAEKGSVIVQHLLYKFPQETKKEPILMRRRFNRVGEVEEIDEQAMKESSAQTIPTQTPPKPNHQAPNSPKRPAQQQAAAPPVSPRATGEAVEHPSLASKSVSICTPALTQGPPELWVALIMCVMVIGLCSFALNADLVDLKRAMPILLLAVTCAVFVRSQMKTELGLRILLDARARWLMVVAVMIANTWMFVFIVQNETTSPIFRIVTVTSCSGMLVLSRVIAAPVLAELDSQLRLMLMYTLLCASCACFVMFGAGNPTALACLVVVVATRLSEHYQQLHGYERYEAQSPSKGNVPKVKDPEGKTLSVRVVDSRIVGKKHASYKVSVSHQGETWFVWRRFSQFDNLRYELRRVFGSGTLPQLPPKTWFSSLDENFVYARSMQLDEFCQQLFGSEKLRGPVFKIAEAKKFLGMSRRSSACAGVEKGETPRTVDSRTLVPSPEESRELTARLRKALAELDKAIAVGEGDGWKFLKKYRGVQCYLKSENGLTFTKGVGVIDAPPLVVASFMENPANRKCYDDLFASDTILRELDSQTVSAALQGMVDVAEVRHTKFSSPFPMAIGARDTVLAQCRMIAKDGTVTFVLTSAPDELCPPSKKFVRAQVFLAGILLAPNPTKPGTCIMTNVQMMDPNGSIPGWVIKSVAPERCAMSSLIADAIRKVNPKPKPLKIPTSH